ncbi:MAG: hypothetical protein ACE5HF_07395 [Gemmatimonadota bacterium]
MTRKIELVYDRGCPNVEAARDVLRRALGAAGLPPEWKEWDREAPGSPAHAKRYGSPTVLVGGADVSGGGAESEANCCRVYEAADGGLRGVPALEDIVRALAGDDR